MTGWDLRVGSVGSAGAWERGVVSAFGRGCAAALQDLQLGRMAGRAGTVASGTTVNCCNAA